MCRIVRSGSQFTCEIVTDDAEMDVVFHESGFPSAWEAVHYMMNFFRVTRDEIQLPA